MAVIQTANEPGDSNSVRQLANQMTASVGAPNFESQQQLPNPNIDQNNAFLEPPNGLFSMPPPPQPPRRSRQQQSPMQNYQNLLGSGSVNHGINHGFMSSFLQGEKEKMTSAAMQTSSKQFQNSNNLDTAASASAAAAPQSSAQAATSGILSSSTSQTAPSNADNSSQQPTTNAQQVVQNQHQHQHQNHHHNQPQHLRGGLMPMMMMPLSMMPDNMIGQAYNAATQQALSVESGTLKIKQVVLANIET